MNVLALDTSTDVASLALLSDGALLAERSISARMDHAAQLFSCLNELLASCAMKAADVNLSAVGVGPGSFSGIRVSIAAAKGLRLALGIPIVGVPSVDAVAADAVERLPRSCRQVAVVLDARRDEWFLALYQVEKNSVTATQHSGLILPGALPSLIEHPTLIVGPENPKLGEKILGLPWPQAVSKSHSPDSVDEPPDYAVVAGLAFVEKRAACPRAAMIGRLGLEKFRDKGPDNSRVEPIYLRPAAEMYRTA